MNLRSFLWGAARVVIGSEMMILGYQLPSHFHWYVLTGYYLGTALILAGVTLALSIF